MSVSVIGAATDQLVTAECIKCELPFLETPDRAEAAFLVGVHNDVQHGGRDEAVLVVSESEAPEREAAQLDPVDLSDEDADEL